MRTNRYTTYHLHVSLTIGLTLQTNFLLKLWPQASTLSTEVYNSIARFSLWQHGFLLKLKTDRRAFFTQPPSGRRRMRICFTVVIFVVFFRPPKLWDNRSRNGWMDFHETFTKRYRWKCSLKRRAAAWRKSCRRLANGECWWLRNLWYDSFAITRKRHARRLRYTTMRRRMDVI